MKTKEIKRRRKHKPSSTMITIMLLTRMLMRKQMRRSPVFVDIQ